MELDRDEPHDIRLDPGHPHGGLHIRADGLDVASLARSPVRREQLVDLAPHRLLDERQHRRPRPQGEADDGVDIVSEQGPNVRAHRRQSAPPLAWTSQLLAWQDFPGRRHPKERP